MATSYNSLYSNSDILFSNPSLYINRPKIAIMLGGLTNMITHIIFSSKLLKKKI